MMGARRRNQPRRYGQKRASPASTWARYEAIKLELTATTRTAAEYEAACRQAANLAGV